MRGQHLPVRRQLGRHLDPTGTPIGVSDHPPLQILLLVQQPPEIAVLRFPVKQLVRLPPSQTALDPCRKSLPVRTGEFRRISIGNSPDASRRLDQVDRLQELLILGCATGHIQFGESTRRFRHALSRP